MRDGQIFEMIILLLCTGGSGVLFYGIGVWASGRSDPMHFWAGSTVDPKTISDIPGYNRANGIMWKRYSAPFFLSALFSILGLWFQWANVVVLVLLTLACTLGIVWLIWEYKRICRKYKVS